MSDLIDRRAAIDAIANCTNCGDEKTLRAYVAKHNLDNGWTGGVLEAIDAIEGLPSAQPERKKGGWINEGRIIRCSKCKIGYAAVKGMKSALTYNFCPNCGASMREDNNGGSD